MKVFKPTNCAWGAKINFVDDNNVLVGFDMGSSCCESFGAFLSREIPDQVNNWSTDYEDNGINPDGFQFDKEFFHTKKPTEGFDDGGIATFRLTKGDEEIFLTLFNSHNGYYSHGFWLEVGGTKIQEDYL